MGLGYGILELGYEVLVGLRIGIRVRGFGAEVRDFAAGVRGFGRLKD